MTESGGNRAVSEQPTAGPSANGVAAIGTTLVVLTALSMLALPSPLTVGVGFPSLSSALAAAAGVMFASGGYWLATTGLGRGSVVLSSLGVVLTQAGYGLFGAAGRWLVPPGLRVPALGLTAALLATITGAVGVTVFRSARSFADWRRYASVLLGGGLVLGAIAALTAPGLLALAGVAVLLGFVADLTYGVWAVRERQSASTVLNGVATYAALTGVFVHGVRLAVRLLGDEE